jgi:hypothetical protein
MADTITFSELGLSGVGPVKQVAPKSFLVGSLPQSDIQDLVSDLANKQPLDATLTALSGLDNAAGALVQIGIDSFTKRTFQDSSNIVWTVADGVSGNFNAKVSDSGVTPGTYGNFSSAVSIQIGLDGRITSASSSAIQITESQVTNLVTDLAGKQPLNINLTNLAAIGSATFGGNLSFANSFTTSGNFSVTQTYTDTTNVTFPTSGTLATTAQLPTPAALTKVDDTNVTITLGGSPSNALLQGVSLTMGWNGQAAVPRGGTGLASTTPFGLIAGGATSTGNFQNVGTGAGGTILQGNGTGALPSFSTATYPATTTINQILFSSANNTISGLATTNNGVLITSAGGVPSISSTLPNAVQDNITRTGTITSGIWNGSVIPGQFGGTGVANTERTITLGGNISTANSFTTSGNFAVTQTYTGTTNVTFPTSGTLATIIKSSRTVTSSTTLTASDNGGIVYCNSASIIEITLPRQSTAVLSNGFNCKIINLNIGDVRIIKEGSDVLVQGNNVIGQADDADIYLVSAGTPNIWQMTGGTPVLPVTYQWTIPTGSNTSFIICGIIPAYTVFVQSYFKTNAGTITGVLTINGVSVVGTMAMSSTQNYASLTSPNVAAPGSILGITTSANSAATFVHVTVFGYQRYYLS